MKLETYIEREREDSITETVLDTWETRVTCDVEFDDDIVEVFDIEAHDDKYGFELTDSEIEHLTRKFQEMAWDQACEENEARRDYEEEQERDDRDDY